MRTFFQSAVGRGAALLTAAILMLSGCGGGGGGSGSGAASFTGQFVDAPVVGLSYKCGTSSTVTGTTDSNGNYTCKEGEAVGFYVGDILLGSVASAKAIVTPLDLVGLGASPSNTEVKNIVRFLLSISTTNSAGNLVIDPTAAANAKGKSVDFKNISQADLGTVVGDVVKGKTLVAESTAVNHMTDSIYKLFAKSYAGTYSGTSSGSWNISISQKDGSVTGTYTTSVGGSGAISGQMSTAMTVSSTYGFTGGAGFSTWNGTLNVVTGVFSGTWDDGGTFTGNVSTAPVASGTPTATGFSPTSAAGGSTVTLTGTNLAAVTDVLFTGPSPSTDFVSGSINNQSATSITTTVPMTLTAGDYRITIVHSGGESEFSGAFTVPAMETAPAAPTSVAATSISATQVNLAWPTVTGATGYNVYRDTTSNFVIGSSKKITTSPVAALKYNDTTLTGLTQYYYKVTAVNSTGEGLESTQVAARSKSIGLSISPTFKSAVSFADKVKVRTITTGAAQLQYRQTSADSTVATNGDEDFLDVTYLVSGALTTLNVSLNVGAPHPTIANATAFAMTQISCTLAGTSLSKPTCSSLGVTFDQAAGTLTFASTPFVYAAQSTTHNATGTLSFDPF